MNNIDAVLIGIVFAVWAALAFLYATVDMIRMPAAAAIWGSGAVLFLALTVVLIRAGPRGRR